MWKTLLTFLIILLVILPLLLIGGGEKRDAKQNSIKTQGKASPEDTTIVKDLIDYSFEDKSLVPFAIYNSLEGLEQAKKIRYEQGIDKIFSNLKIRRLEDWNEENYISFQASLLKDVLNNDEEFDEVLYDSLGYYYLNEGRYYKALECFRSIAENLEMFHIWKL